MKIKQITSLDQKNSEQQAQNVVEIQRNSIKNK